MSTNVSSDIVTFMFKMVCSDLCSPRPLCRELRVAVKVFIYVFVRSKLGGESSNNVTLVCFMIPTRHRSNEDVLDLGSFTAEGQVNAESLLAYDLALGVPAIESIMSATKSVHISDDRLINNECASTQET